MPSAQAMLTHRAAFPQMEPVSFSHPVRGDEILEDGRSPSADMERGLSCPIRNPLHSALIIRQKEPTNLETPLDQVDSYLTPTELFYIRSHFPAPKLALASYQLLVDGAVRNPLSLSYEQLRDMPSETRIATLECAGNGRVFLVPQVAGAQWELGAVGNAQWTGVPLGALLERTAWKKTLARSSSKEPIEGRRQKSLSLPARSPTPGACPGIKQFSRKCWSRTR